MSYSKFKTYRFNPLYEEERPDKDDGLTKDVANHGDDDQETVSTTSSGYGSNTTQKGKFCHFIQILLLLSRILIYWIL